MTKTYTQPPWVMSESPEGSEITTPYTEVAVMNAGSIISASEPGDELHDARLIAAAPELLEAAQIVLAGLNARIEGADLESVPVFDGIADIHDAINKATGETNEKPC